MQHAGSVCTGQDLLAITTLSDFRGANAKHSMEFAYGGSLRRMDYAEIIRKLESDGQCGSRKPESKDDGHTFSQF